MTWFLGFVWEHRGRSWRYLQTANDCPWAVLEEEKMAPAGSVAKNHSHLKVPVTVNPIQNHLPATRGFTCSSRDSPGSAQTPEEEMHVYGQ